jgi:hypothetical protein
VLGISDYVNNFYLTPKKNITFPALESTCGENEENLHTALRGGRFSAGYSPVW